ncbi:DUF6973 domain-containing protein [Clostridium pasteurianum]|nr:hypothetical protein [Clostridium pasteurianum]
MGEYKMKKKYISFLVATLLVTTLSSSIVFAKTSTTLNNTEQVNVLHKSYDDIIKEKGEVLSYDDFTNILNEVKNNNKELTNDYAKKLIVDKINEKVNSTIVTPSYTIWGKNLNSAELALVAAYPSQAVFVYADANTALSTAQSLYQSSTLYLGNGDAFRHTYWNGLMAKDIGETYASYFANAHEAQTPSGPDKTMDLNNNDVGRRLARYTSRSNLKSEVIRYCDNGWLNRVVNGVLTVTDSSGKL